jgi:branched-chain amino acid aminotransferase
MHAITVYFNDVFYTEDQANTIVPYNDRGYLLGDGLFETIRINDGNPCFLDMHYQRLQQSAKLLSLPFNKSLAEITDILQQLTSCNLVSSQQGVARITLSRGISPRGIMIPIHQQPSLLITVAAANPIKYDTYTMVVAKTISKNAKSISARIKTTSYLDYILARQEANLQQAHDALLLNTEGKVAEATCANIFMVVDNQLYTPPETDGVLPGIMRANIIKACQILDIPCHIQSFTLAELAQAEAIFLTNVLIQLQSVTEIKEVWQAPSNAKKTTVTEILLHYFSH